MAAQRYVLRLETEGGEPLNQWPLVLLPSDADEETFCFLVARDREKLFDDLALDLISNEGLD